MDDEESKVKMVLPFKCPCCSEDIIINLDLIPPVIKEVKRYDEADPEVKKLIENENATDDTPEEPEAS